MLLDDSFRVEAVALMCARGGSLLSFAITDNAHAHVTSENPIKQRMAYV